MTIEALHLRVINNAFIFRLCTAVVVLTFSMTPLIQQPQQQSSIWMTSRATGFVVVVVVVEALPSGAAGCDCCTAASMGFHRDFGRESASGRLGDTGPLSEFNTSFRINNVVQPPLKNSTTTGSGGIVPSPLKSTIFNGGTELSWSVRARERLQIRGILLRVQPVDDTVEFTLTGDSSVVQEAVACYAQKGNVEGITHLNRDGKKNVTGTMRFDTDGTVKIDLTVVYMNGRVAPDDQSMFAHSSFEIVIRHSPPTLPFDNAPVPSPPPTRAPVDDRCVANTCRAFFGLLSGRLHNRFHGGQCRERCSAISLFVSPMFGWRCGGCF